MSKIVWESLNKNQIDIYDFFDEKKVALFIERPFENITPVQNIKVGYFEKEEYLKIIDRQEKQIDSFAYQIRALQSRIDFLEKENKKLRGENERKN